MKNGKKSFLSKTVLLFGAAAVLLVASTVGSARAALTYYSENYEMQVSVSYIGVSLEENGKTVSSRSYDANSRVTEVTGALLAGLRDAAGEGKGVLPGRKYEEKLSVTNQGQIDCYVRVIVRKSWVDPANKNEKNTTLSPELIWLDMDKADSYNGWEKDSQVSGAGGSDAYQEQMVLYYKNALAPGQSSLTFNDMIGIDPAITGKFTQVTEGNTTTAVYAYSGYGLGLEVEVDAVQTHNAQDAIKSAWGVDVDIAADGTLSLR